MIIDQSTHLGEGNEWLNSAINLYSGADNSHSISAINSQYSPLLSVNWERLVYCVLIVLIRDLSESHLIHYHSQIFIKFFVFPSNFQLWTRLSILGGSGHVFPNTAAEGTNSQLSLRSLGTAKDHRPEWSWSTSGSIRPCLHLLHPEPGSARSPVQNPRTASVPIRGSSFSFQTSCAFQKSTNIGGIPAEGCDLGATRISVQWTGFVDYGNGGEGRSYINLTRWYCDCVQSN